MQRTHSFAAHQRGLGRSRLLARTIGIEMNKRIQLRLERRDSFEVRLHDLDR